MGRILLLCLLFVSVVVGPISCSSDSPSADKYARQKAQVVALALERAVTEQDTDARTATVIPGYDLMEDKENVILSIANIEESWVPHFSSVRYIPLTEEEIQAKADAEGDFLYFRFGDITAVDESTIVVELDCVWAVAVDSPCPGKLSGGGFTIEYHREHVEWVGEEKEWWIS